MSNTTKENAWKRENIVANNLMILLGNKSNEIPNPAFKWLYRTHVLCCLTLYTCSARIPLILLPFQCYNRNNGKQFEQTIIEWPMRVRLASVITTNRKIFRPRLIWQWVFPLRDCVLQCMIHVWLPVFSLSVHNSRKFQLKLRIVWETHS